MILHCLPMVHFLPYLQHGCAEIGRKLVEPGFLELDGCVRNGLQGLFQNFGSLTQDATRSQWTVSTTGKSVPCRTP
jgi:hypothetical protein